MKTEHDKILHGLRRFTCLSPTLIRMEYSPDGQFEDRRSMVANQERSPIPFVSQKEENGVLTLKTEKLTVISKSSNRAFYPHTLEVLWVRDNLTHYWRAGDRDLQNLGGTVRSLDGFSESAPLSGNVHVADGSCVDNMANRWVDGELVWEAKAYHEMNSQGPYINPVTGDRHLRYKYDSEKILQRGLNIALDQHRYAPGLLSKSGYFLLNDSDSAVMNEQDFPVERNRPGIQDWYFFGYGWDYRQALQDFILLSGKSPLPTKNTFGLMMCRWPAYDEQEAMALSKEFASYDLPLSSLIIDMEWHQKGWHHWDWNPDTYPDPKRFFDWCRKNNIETALNVHPQAIPSSDSNFEAYMERTGLQDEVYLHDTLPEEPFVGIDVNMADRKQAEAFMDLCHTPKINQGLDYWWVDGANASICSSTTDQLITNKVFFENARKGDKRGMLLSRYGGLGSHRYGVFFTGDTRSQWGALEQLCEFNIRAGHAGLNYISHDTGGFAGPRVPLIDPVLYVRWLQFGVFNPVLRFHSAPGCGSRHPWDYGEDILKTCLKWLKIRYSLIPYIYSASREHFEKGLPLTRGLFLDDPQNQEAYRYDQFMFGDSLLVAPLLTGGEERELYLPEGSWVEFESGKIITGGKTIRSFHLELDSYPVYVKSGSILLRQRDEVHPLGPVTENLWLDLYPGGDAEATLYEDDGKTRGYEEGAYLKTAFHMKQSENSIEIRVNLQGEWPSPQRNLNLSVQCLALPQSISMNGQSQKTENGIYDESTRRFFIHLGQVNLDQDFYLKIQL